MNIETREVRLGWSEKGERERNLKVYESFGWKYTQDVRRGKSSYDLLARDMDMPNYRLIKALDDKVALSRRLWDSIIIFWLATDLPVDPYRRPV